MTLEELRTIIQESEFANILHNHGFQEVYQWNETNDGYHDRYLIGFESNICRMGFYYEPGGGISIFLGTLSESFNHLESREWIGLNYAIAYILNQPIIQGYPYKGKSQKDQILGFLSAIAKDFEPLAGQILSMFRDGNAVAQWKPALEKYMKQETKNRFGLG